MEQECGQNESHVLRSLVSKVCLPVYSEVTWTKKRSAACASWSLPSGVRGLGRERGTDGIRAFQELKHMAIGNLS
jgi:hypothetical protein